MEICENRILCVRRMTSCALFETKEELQMVSPWEGTIRPPLMKAATEWERKKDFIPSISQEWPQTCSWLKASTSPLCIERGQFYQKLSSAENQADSTDTVDEEKDKKTKRTKAELKLVLEAVMLGCQRCWKLIVSWWPRLTAKIFKLKPQQPSTARLAPVSLEVFGN